jgi:uncharacterized protein YutD
MKKDEIVLYLEENGFVENKENSFFQKKIIQNNDEIIVEVTNQHCTTFIRSRLLAENNICYHSTIDVNRDVIFNMDQIIRVITAISILLKTFYEEKEPKTTVLVKINKLWTNDYIRIRKSQEEVNRIRILPVNPINQPPFRISCEKDKEYFQFARPVAFTGTHSEMIYIDDLFNNKYKDKKFEDLKWRNKDGF